MQRQLLLITRFFASLQRTHPNFRERFIARFCQADPAIYTGIVRLCSACYINPMIRCRFADKGKFILALAAAIIAACGLRD